MLRRDSLQDLLCCRLAVVAVASVDVVVIIVSFVVAGQFLHRQRKLLQHRLKQLLKLFLLEYAVFVVNRRSTESRIARRIRQRK